MRWLRMPPAVMACAVLVALFAPIAPTRAQMTLEQAMALAKPQAFGSSVFAAWWTADGRQLVYQTFPAGARSLQATASRLPMAVCVRWTQPQRRASTPTSVVSIRLASASCSFAVASCCATCRATTACA
jgi:hypothetical protein